MVARRRQAGSPAALAILLLLIMATPAFAGDELEGHVAAGTVGAGGGHSTEKGKANGSASVAGTAQPVRASGPWFEYYLAPTCTLNGPDGGVSALCMGAIDACPQNHTAAGNAGYIQMWRYRRQVGNTGQPLPGAAWTQVGAVCVGPAAAAAAAQGVVRPSLPLLVVRAWRQVDIAAASAIVQPPGGTLVNLPAIFHTDGAEQTFEVTILGHAVRLIAIPVSYTWHFGDGTTRSTTGPGAPYPSREITETYQHPGGYPVSVDVTFRGEFTVDGGARQPLPGQTTVTGPATTLRVLESRTHLVAD